MCRWAENVGATLGATVVEPARIARISSALAPQVAPKARAHSLGRIHGTADDMPNSAATGKQLLRNYYRQPISSALRTTGMPPLPKEPIDEFPHGQIKGIQRHACGVLAMTACPRAQVVACSIVSSANHSQPADSSRCSEWRA
jgi:hypothetical protein